MSSEDKLEKAIDLLAMWMYTVQGCPEDKLLGLLPVLYNTTGEFVSQFPKRDVSLVKSQGNAWPPFPIANPDA